MQLLEDFRFAPIRDAIPMMTMLKQTKTVMIQRNLSPSGNEVRIDIGQGSTVKGREELGVRRKA